MASRSPSRLTWKWISAFTRAVRSAHHQQVQHHPLLESQSLIQINRALVFPCDVKKCSFPAVLDFPDNRADQGCGVSMAGVFGMGTDCAHFGITGKTQPFPGHSQQLALAPNSKIRTHL